MQCKSDALPERENPWINSHSLLISLCACISYTIFIHSYFFFFVISSNIITLSSLNVRRIHSETFRHSACAYDYCYYPLSKSGWVTVHGAYVFYRKNKSFRWIPNKMFVNVRTVAQAANIISGLMCTILITFDCFVVPLISDTMDSMGFIQIVRW